MKPTNVLTRRLGRTVITAAVAIVILAGCPSASTDGSFWDGTQDARTWKPVGSPGFTSAQAIMTRLVISGSLGPVAAFKDGATGQLSVWRWDGSAWSMMGPRGISEADISFIDLAVDRQGAPIVAYQDLNHSSHLSVQRWNGSSWDYFLGAGLGSADRADNLALAVDSTGAPWVSFIDGSASMQVTVARWEGLPSGWVVKYGPGFSGGTCNETDTAIAVSSRDSVVVAYTDGDQGNKLTCRKWTGTSWDIVGAAGFTESSGAQSRMAIGPGDVPYVVFQDMGMGGRATVMRFSAGSWQDVGARGITKGQADNPTIAFSPGGSLYIACQDVGSGDRAVVLRFTGADWVSVGPEPGISAGVAQSASVAVDAAGNPYVLFNDDAAGFGATLLEYD
jgi:hypothetical protein